MRVLSARTAVPHSGSPPSLRCAFQSTNDGSTFAPVLMASNSGTPKDYTGGRRAQYAQTVDRVRRVGAHRDGVVRGTGGVRSGRAVGAADVPPHTSGELAR